MANYSVFKETVLPGALIANAIYLIAPAADPTLLEVYVTSNDGLAVRHTPTKSEIDGWISAAIIAAGNARISVVADITARDAIATPNEGDEAWVTDASADATVAAGAAKYIWDGAAWLKVSEAESMDVTINWTDVVGGPTSTPTQIDTAVTNTHTHANKTELDKFGEDGDGDPTYNGAFIRTSFDSTAW